MTPLALVAWQPALAALLGADLRSPWSSGLLGCQVVQAWLTYQIWGFNQQIVDLTIVYFCFFLTICCKSILLGACKLSATLQTTIKVWLYSRQRHKIHAARQHGDIPGDSLRIESKFKSLVCKKQIIALASAALRATGFTFAMEVRKEPSTLRPWKAGCAWGECGQLPPHPICKMALSKCEIRRRRNVVGFFPSHWKIHWSKVTTEQQWSCLSHRTAGHAHVLAGLWALAHASGECRMFEKTVCNNLRTIEEHLQQKAKESRAQG